jgi:hypothetical protein
MSNSIPGTEPWGIQDARNLYNIHRWGADYFDINEAGHVVAKPLRDAGAVVDVTDVIEEAKGRGLKFPVLIRFQDILRHRVESINLAFRSAITEFNYQGGYRGVFPIKVNQLREVVEEILEAGKPYEFGLEVGSKPELFAGLALQNQMGSLIVCNGYKDANFVRMALLGIKLGKKVIMVVEKLEELRQIITVSRQLGVEPLIGVRARLLSKGGGKWADSAGENAKFGLSTAELLAAMELLKTENLAHCFKLSISISDLKSPISSWSNAPFRKPRVSMRSCTKWDSISSSLMSGEGSGLIMTAAVPPSTVRPITPSRNTRTTSSITLPTSVILRRCRILASSVKAAAPLSLIIVFSLSRCSEPSKRSKASSHFSSPRTSTPSSKSCSTFRRTSPA